MMWMSTVMIILNLVLVVAGLVAFFSIPILLYKIYKNTKPRPPEAPVVPAAPRAVETPVAAKPQSASVEAKSQADDAIDETP